MTIIGSAYVEVRALDTNLRNDIDKAVSKIKDITVKIKGDLDLTAVRAQIAALRAEVKGDPLKIKAELDISSVTDKMLEAHALAESNPINIKTESDTSSVERALADIRNRNRVMRVDVSANANTARAEVQLDTLARKRDAIILPKIQLSSDIQKALQGLTYTLLGAIPGPAIEAAIADVLANIEQFSIATAKLATKFGSLGAEALTLSSNILSLGGDLTTALQIVAAAPAGFSALAAILVGTQIAWNNFGGAMSSNAKTAQKALALLPVEAQKAALSLKELVKDLTKPAQKAFWVEMGTSLQDTVKSMVPSLRGGLEAVDASLARMTKQGLNAFKALNDSGGLDTLFANISKGIDAASNAVYPFFNALNTLSVTGSKYLPVFGDWLTKLADRFNNFITEADKTGKIDQWINNSVRTIKELGGVISDTTRIFKGLTAVADSSGGKGLQSFSDGMKKIADTVNSEPFKTKLGIVFDGARTGSEHLAVGIKSLADVVENGSTSIGLFLDLAGQIGGSALTNFSEIFNAGAGSGLVDLMIGAKNAVDDIKPAFHDLGHILFDVGKISATVMENMGPGFNSLFDTLAQVVDKLRDAIIKVIPIFNDFVVSVLSVAKPIVVAIADALSQVLTTFSEMPKGIQIAIMSFGLFLLVLSKVKDMWKDYKGRVADARDEAEKTGTKYQSLGDKLKKVGQGAKDSAGQIKESFALAGTAAGLAGIETEIAFSTIGQSAKNVGQSVSAGVQASLAQLRGAYEDHLKGPMQTFKAGIKAGFKEAFNFGEDISKGFNQIKAEFSNAAKAIGTGVKTAFSSAKDGVTNAMSSIKDGVKGAFVNLPGALKEFPKELGSIFNDAKITALNSFDDMRTHVSDASVYMSKRMSDFGTGVKETAIGAKNNIQQHMSLAAAYVGSSFAPVATAVGKSMSEIAVAGSISAGVLKDKISIAAGDITSKLSTATAPVRAKFSEMATAVGDSFSRLSTAAGKGLSEVAVAGSITAGVVKDKMSQAFGQLAINAADNTAHFRQSLREAGQDIGNVVSNVKSGFTTLGTHIASTASTARTVISSTLGQAMSNLQRNFSPVGSAISEGFKGIGPALAPAVTAVGEFGRAAGGAAGQLGIQAGKGLKAAAGGLLSAVGGPWGLAIGAATTAITLMGQASADSDARVKAFQDTLVAGTGAMTGATKNLQYKSLFDGATNAWDDFVRGALNHSKTVNETLDSLDINTQKYFDTMSNPSSRDKYIAGLDKVQKALRSGQNVTEDMAAAIGTTSDKLNNLSFEDKRNMGASLDHVKVKAQDMAKELSKAEEENQKLARATGVSTVQMSILSKNFETLKSTTSSASDKFSALKQNLELLNQGSNAYGKAKTTSLSVEKAYQQSLADSAKAIQAVRDENNGLIKNLVDVNGQFDLTSQAGRDLHSALSTQSDAIIQLGASAMDAALKGGKAPAEAQKAAISAMQPGIDALKANLKSIGFDPGQIDGIVKQLGLIPDNITTALGIEGGAAARQEILLTTLAGDAFKSGNYEAVLSALPDAAKQAIEQTQNLSGAFARGDYKAILTALDNTKGGRSQALLNLLTITGPSATHDAFIQALNGTGPGVQAAGLSISAVTNKDYSALIKAKKDNSNDPEIEAALNYLARTRTATIQVQTIDGASVPAGAVVHVGQSGVGANGGLFSDMSKMFSGKFPMAKAFANGGVENHIAQISQGQTPFRVWSEPETGGEAYIPLGINKRVRSLKILEEVAKIFGFNLVKQFSTGGLLAGFNTGPTSASIGGSSNSTTTTAVATTGTGSSAPNIILQVNPSAALDEEKVGKVAASELYWQFINR